MPALQLRAQVGIAPYGAGDPYAGGVSIVARGGGAIRLNDRHSIELELYALGALGAGDAYPPNDRALPNTSGVAVGLERFITSSNQLSLSGGFGFFRVAARAEARDRSGVGLYLGGTRVLSQSTRFVLTLDARIVVMPEMRGSHLWLVPLSVGARLW